MPRITARKAAPGGRCRSGDDCPRAATVPHSVTGRPAWCDIHAAELGLIGARLGVKHQPGATRSAPAPTTIPEPVLVTGTETRNRWGPLVDKAPFVAWLRLRIAEVGGQRELARHLGVQERHLRLILNGTDLVALSSVDRAVTAWGTPNALARLYPDLSSSGATSPLGCSE